MSLDRSVLHNVSAVLSMGFMHLVEVIPSGMLTLFRSVHFCLMVKSIRDTCAKTVWPGVPFPLLVHSKMDALHCARCSSIGPRSIFSTFGEAEMSSGLRSSSGSCTRYEPALHNERRKFSKAMSQRKALLLSPWAWLFVFVCSLVSKSCSPFLMRFFTGSIACVECNVRNALIGSDLICLLSRERHMLPRTWWIPPALGVNDIHTEIAKTVSTCCGFSCRWGIHFKIHE